MSNEATETAGRSIVTCKQGCRKIRKGKQTLVNPYMLQLLQRRSEQKDL